MIATRIRAAIKRLTDAFAWGALEEDEYRQQLERMRAELAAAERVPEERRILEATGSRRMCLALGRSLRVNSAVGWSGRSSTGSGSQAAASSPCIRERSPRRCSLRRFTAAVPTGSKPQYRTLAGIVIEGIEDLADIADGAAWAE